MEDAISEATLACLEELPGFDPDVYGRDISGFLGQRANWRLLDWQRREKVFSVRTTRRGEDGIERKVQELVPWRPDMLVEAFGPVEDVVDDLALAHRNEPAVVEHGYELVEALDFHRRLVKARAKFADDPLRWHAITRNARLVAAGAETRIVHNQVYVVGSPLSPTERLAIIGAARGETSDTTAARLHKSPETIKAQKRAVIARLGAHNMTHAVALAFAKNILQPSDLEADPAE